MGEREFVHTLAAPLRPTSVTVVHDYLTQRGGAERVTLAIMDAFPQATLITSFYNPATTFARFQGHRVIELGTGLARNTFRADPRLAFFRLGKLFAEYTADTAVTICSTSGWAHAVNATGRKVVYCHNPARWIYQPEDYFLRYGTAAGRAAARFTSRLMDRDRRWAESADVYLANSSSVRERVARAYGRDAQIIFPPAGLGPDGPIEEIPSIEPGFFLTISRARAYKNTAAIVDAVLATRDARLVVVGGRVDERATATGRVANLSGISDAQLRWLYANCAAVIAVGREDFGLTPVEGYLFGKPVIALRAGGYLDSTVEHQTGIFVDDDSADAIRAGIEAFRPADFRADTIRVHGAQFTSTAFAERLRAAALTRAYS